jgi:hypothetical protein
MFWAVTVRICKAEERCAQCGRPIPEGTVKEDDGMCNVRHLECALERRRQGFF